MLKRSQKPQHYRSISLGYGICKCSHVKGYPLSGYPYNQSEVHFDAAVSAQQQVCVCDSLLVCRLNETKQ